MKREQEILARAMGHIDDDLILAARAPHKKVRRVIPLLITACLVIAFLAAFPYLRTIINTDLTLRGPEHGGNVQDGAQNPNTPSTYEFIPQGIPSKLGGTTLVMNAVTETTVNFTMVKTDNTPVYAILYDRLYSALACTDDKYTDNGVTIRPYVIRVYVDGAEEPAYELPSAPGTYEVVVDFTSIRNGSYLMQNCIGLYSPVDEDDKDKKPTVLRFDLAFTPEADTTAPADTETDAAPADTAESDTVAP